MRLRAIGLLALLLTSQAAAATWDGPIFIQGLQDMDAEHGVTGGSGTLEDPFVIGPWQINSDEPALTIHGVDAAVRITGIQVMGAQGHGIQVTDVPDLRLDNITIQGVSGETVDDAHGVRVVDAGTVSAHDVTVTRSQGSGIWFTNVSDLAASRLVATHNAGYGIWVEEVRGGSVTNSIGSSNERNGLYLCFSDDMHILRSDFSENDWIGADLTASHRNTFTDNRFARNGFDGIKIIRSDEARLLANTFSGHPDYGVHLVESDSTQGQDNVFADNRKDVHGGTLIVLDAPSGSPTGAPVPEHPMPVPATASLVVLFVVALAMRRFDV